MPEIKTALPSSPLDLLPQKNSEQKTTPVSLKALRELREAFSKLSGNQIRGFGLLKNMLDTNARFNCRKYGEISQLLIPEAHTKEENERNTELRKVFVLLLKHTFCTPFATNRAHETFESARTSLKLCKEFPTVLDDEIVSGKGALWISRITSWQRKQIHRETKAFNAKSEDERQALINEIENILKPSFPL